MKLNCVFRTDKSRNFSCRWINFAFVTTAAFLFVVNFIRRSELMDFLLSRVDQNRNENISSKMSKNASTQKYFHLFLFLLFRSIRSQFGCHHRVFVGVSFSPLLARRAWFQILCLTFIAKIFCLRVYFWCRCKSNENENEEKFGDDNDNDEISQRTHFG